MARFFFDAAGATVAVADLQGREIQHKDELRPALLEAVRAIRQFIGADLSSQEWSLEVRLGQTNRVATMRFDEIDVGDAPATADAVALLAA